MYVYLIRCEENSYYKIGITKNIQKRIKELQTGSSDIIYLVNKYESDFASKIEKGLHNFLGHKRRNNEWFDLTIEDEVNFIDMCTKIEKNLIYLEQNKI